MRFSVALLSVLILAFAGEVMAQQTSNPPKLPSGKIVITDVNSHRYPRTQADVETGTMGVMQLANIVEFQKQADLECQNSAAAMSPPFVCPEGQTLIAKRKSTGNFCETTDTFEQLAGKKNQQIKYKYLATIECVCIANSTASKQVAFTIDNTDVVLSITE